MTIKSALETYFARLKEKYRDTYGSLPTVSWGRDLDGTLFVGSPDKDGEIQWDYQPANEMVLKGLCAELRELYNSYYYWHLCGRYNDFDLYFPPVPTQEEAIRVAQNAVKEGKYYFPRKSAVLLAMASSFGNDSLLLFFDQDDKTLFLYDTDMDTTYFLEDTLAEVIDFMEVII